MSRGWLWVSLGIAIGLVVTWFGVERAHRHDLAAVEDPSAVDGLHLGLDELDTTEWVERYLPERSFGGFLLTLYQRRVPMLIDMAGRVVHVWPRVRAVGRIRLDRHGNLLVIGTDDLIKVYDWDGRLTWYFRLPEAGDTPHHDVIWLASGNVLVLAKSDRNDRGDFLLEVNRAGRVVWRWWADEHREAFPSWTAAPARYTHINSIHELPRNQWFDGGDQRFRPGNLLVSARNLDTVFVIDKLTGAVTWQYSHRLDRQHEAIMIPPGQLGEGLVLLFNNGLTNRYEYRRSEVLAIDPVGAREVWAYRDRFFFSSTGGVQQALANGNVMICSSQGGRAFEITPDGEIVWQWTPPYLPMRPERIAPDHCPQLAAVSSPVGPIPSRRGRPHIDQELHTFAVTGEYRVRDVDGSPRQLLPDDAICSKLWMPPGPTLQLSYGLDRERLGDAKLAATFTYRLRGVGFDWQQVVFQDTVDETSDQLWRNRWMQLPFGSYLWYELCVDVAIDTDLPEKRAAGIAEVENPRFDCADRPRLPDEVFQGVLSARERELQQRQLRALGYVN